MSRGYKFRAWDDNAKVMLDWLTITQSAFNSPDKNHPEWKGLLSQVICASHRPNNLHVMQFTGLTDYKGTEIYEGDVVRMHQILFDGAEIERDSFGYITYLATDSFSGGGIACYALKLIGHSQITEYMGYSGNEPVDCDPIPIQDFYGLDDQSFEIIGNIHEHPELLHTA